MIDVLDFLEAGDELKEPITESQRQYIYQLTDSSALNDEQKEWYRMCSDCDISYTDAEGLIEELKAVQMDQINLARCGKLKEKGLKAAIRRLVNFPNT